MTGWLLLLLVWGLGGIVLCLFLGAAIALAERRRNRP